MEKKDVIDSDLFLSGVYLETTLLEQTAVRMPSYRL